jgi:hypothetical protein
MALIQETSEECITSPLEWFKVLPTQTAIEKSTTVEYQSLTALRQDVPIEFYVPATTEDYIDLQNSRLCIKCRIVKANGEACGAADIAAPVNDMFNSLFSNVECYFNDRLVSHSNNLHGYISMISHLIHDSEESLESERQMRLIYKDTPGQMNSVNASTPNWNHKISGFDFTDDGTPIAAADVSNHGLYQRYRYTNQSKTVELMGPLRIDMFEQDRYLPNGVDIKLRFHPQKKSFVLMAANDGFKISITDAYLMMRKVRPTPGVLLGHSDAMINGPAKFPVTRKECKTIAVAPNMRTAKQDSISMGQLPKRAVVGCVRGDAAAGNFQKNGYNFEHFNLSHLQMYIDGEPYRSRPLRPNIQQKQYLECYETLYRGMNEMNGEKGRIIKRSDWDKGYALFAFDFTADLDADDHYALIKHGNLRLEVEFAEPLAETITILVYMEYDNVIEITQDRHVAFDYV